MQSKMRLSRFNMIELLKAPQYKGFLSGFQARQFARGNLVSSPEQQSNEVFIVVSGRLRIFLSYEGKEFTLCFLEPGDLFSTHTRVMIEACREATIMSISVARFREEVVRFPEVSLVMTGILGQVLGGTLDVIEGIMFHDVRYRLVEFLLSLADEQGKHTETGTEFGCDLNMEEISLLIGTTRQTASSLLNTLIKEGHLVRLGRGRYRMPEPQTLRSLLEGDDI